MAAEGNELLFNQLIGLCKSKTKISDNQAFGIFKYLEKLYKRAEPAYKSSQDFCEKVKLVKDQINSKPEKKFVFLKDLITELKAYKKAAEAEAVSTKQDVARTTVGVADITLPKEAAVNEITQSDEATERAIARFEALLEAHHREIQRLDNLELSLDDLEKEDSANLVADRLKFRAAKIFAKLCALKQRRVEMGGVREKRFKYSGSRYSELNKHVQKFINNHAWEERMPDYHDIRKIVKKCDVKYGYRLSLKRINELAVEVFTDVGNLLQTCRKQDFVQDFGPSEANRALRTNVGDDPALFSRELREKLEANRCRADKNLADLLSKYSEEQTREVELKEKLKEKESSLNLDDSEQDDDEEVSESSDKSPHDINIEDVESLLNSVTTSSADIENSTSLSTGITSLLEPGAIAINNGGTAETERLEYSSHGESVSHGSVSSPSSSDSSDVDDLSGLDSSSDSDLGEAENLLSVNESEIDTAAVSDERLPETACLETNGVKESVHGMYSADAYGLCPMNNSEDSLLAPDELEENGPDSNFDDDIILLD